jgi:hypothetical protein
MSQDQDRSFMCPMCGKKTPHKESDFMVESYAQRTRFYECQGKNCRSVTMSKVFLFQGDPVSKEGIYPDLPDDYIPKVKFSECPITTVYEIYEKTHTTGHF